MNKIEENQGRITTAGFGSEDEQVDEEEEDSVSEASSNFSSAPAAARPQSESIVAIEELIRTPDRNDVICGRGKSVAHPGNQRFRSIIMSRKDDYKTAYRRDLKTKITLEIVKELRQGPHPVRFLLKDMKSKMWYDAGEAYAREKVSHALRSRPNNERLRNSNKRLQNKQKKKVPRKHTIPPELEVIVQDLINEQQNILKELIKKSKNQQQQSNDNHNIVFNLPEASFLPPYLETTTTTTTNSC